MRIRPRKHLTNKARSKFSERRAAKVFGGRRQPASGAINRFDLKGDIKSDKFLVDDKTTGRKSFSVSVEVWRKLAREAWMNRRKPAMRVEFDDGPALYVIDEETMMQLV